MSWLDERGPIDEAARLIAGIRSRGVQLWSHNGELRYRAPKGVLTANDFAMLRERSAQIAVLLDSFTAMPSLQPRPESGLVPLTYSQRKYWQSDRLANQPVRRSVALAIRMNGQLDLERLRAAIAWLVRRHEALRTTIEVVDDTPTQKIAASAAYPVPVENLTALPERRRETELTHIIRALVEERVHVCQGPLFEARLIKLDTRDHVLVAAMEHMISDGYSLNVFINELFSIYGQIAHGTAALPAVPIQLADYAVWQKQAEPVWCQLHGSYWSERLKGCVRLSFPAASVAARTDAAGWGTVPFVIDRELRGRLLEWARLRRTTLVMAVFTAYVAAVLRWCEASDGVVRYQTDGRFSPLIGSTIGYFAAVLNLRMQLSANDTFLDLLNTVTQEYCRAHEHADFSYIDAQLPRPPFSRGPGFNWIPKQPKGAMAPSNDLQGELTFNPFPFRCSPDPAYEVQDEPFVVLSDKDQIIDGNVVFSPRRVSAESMREFCATVLLFLRELVTDSQQRIAQIAFRRV